MRDIKKIFGWLFGIIAIICIGASFLLFRDELFRSDGIPRLSTFVGSAALLLFAIIDGMACWSTLKEVPAARGWGIGASLVVMSVPLLTLHLSRPRLTIWDMQTIVVGALAFVSYVWPQREKQTSDEDAGVSSRENQEKTNNQGHQPERQSGSRGVLRAHVVLIVVGAALVAVLWTLNFSWRALTALSFLACLAVLFGNELAGPAEHMQISSPRFERRIQNRYHSESNQLSDLGFTPLFFYGEGYSFVHLLLIYPAFFLTIMWLNREVGSVQNKSKLFFGFRVFSSDNGTAYAHPSQLGIKFHTRFQDGSILMTKSFAGKSSYGPNVIAHRMINSSIVDSWAEHQKHIQELEAAGKKIDCEISFEAFSNIQREA